MRIIEARQRRLKFSNYSFWLVPWSPDFKGRPGDRMTTSGDFIYCRLVALYRILRSSTGSPASSPDLPASRPRVDLPEADRGAHVDCGHSSILQPSGSPHPCDNQRSTASSKTCYSGDVMKLHSASVDRSRYCRSVPGCQAGEEAINRSRPFRGTD